MEAENGVSDTATIQNTPELGGVKERSSPRAFEGNMALVTT